MRNPEKNRPARAAPDCWISSQDARARRKRSYPLENFASFADSARRDIEATRQDQFVRRYVAIPTNGLTEFLCLER